MQKKNSSYIALRMGIIKAYRFEDTFYKENKKLCNRLSSLMDLFYGNQSCVFGAIKCNKDLLMLKKRLIKLLNIFFDLGVVIENAFDDIKYKTKESFAEYILTYSE